MTRAAASFKQHDVTRALRATVAAGITVRQIEIDPITGKITITTATGADKKPASDLDKWMATNAR
jgi:hypothetical protein